MNFYKTYTTPFGYEADGEEIDAYGVNHRNFSTRDEVEYQVARQEREKEYENYFKNQGITQNYPQFGSNFWGNNPQNNYGFGQSNIEQNIENRLNQYINSALFPKSMANDDISYKLAQNNQTDVMTDVNSHDTYKLGTLSGEGESKNGKVLFNNCGADKKGGCSYGTYQIATGPGTMKDYLNYLKSKKQYNKFSNSLQQAGGFEAAKQGTDAYKSAWKDLSQYKEFLDSQFNFILMNNYNPALSSIEDMPGLNLNTRSRVIPDVIFSTAVQFGGRGAARLIRKALGNDVSNLSDEDIINKIYDERGYKKYFKSSSDDMQKSIKKNRSVNERQRALELLRKYPH